MHVKRIDQGMGVYASFRELNKNVCLKYLLYLTHFANELERTNADTLRHPPHGFDGLLHCL